MSYEINDKLIAANGFATSTTAVATTTYTALVTDSFLIVDDDTAAAAVTITLPAAATAADGYQLTVKKEGSTAPVTLDGNAAETIDGATTFALEEEGESVTLVCDGTGWHKVAKYYEHEYGSIYVEAGATAQAIPTGATYTKSTAFTTNGATSPASIADATNDKLVLRRGTWAINGTFSFSTDTNAVNVIGAAFLDGVEVDSIHFQRKIGTGSDVGSASFTGFVMVDQETEDLDFRLRHDDAGSVDVTIVYGNLNAHRIG